MVLDRLFLWIFTLAVVIGSAAIVLQAPALYDERIPIDAHLSKIALTNLKNRDLNITPSIRTPLTLKGVHLI